MPGHTRYPYRSMFQRDPLEWPNGAKLAFYVGINIEYTHWDRRRPESGLIDYTMWEYSHRVGVYRIMDALDKHNVRASVLLNSDVCLYEPQIIEEGNKRHWEWLGHGITQSNGMT